VRHWAQQRAARQQAACLDVPRAALHAAECRPVRWARLTAQCQQAAYLVSYLVLFLASFLGVPHDALRAAAHRQAVLLFVAQPQAERRAEGQRRAAEWSDAREPRVEAAALEAQHAAEALGAQPDAGARAVVPAALSDAEPAEVVEQRDAEAEAVEVVEQRASPAAQARPWPAAGHP
jgi:hypothetical protein